MTFIVERQTGLPPNEQHRKYPFGSLKVGDSMKVKGEVEFHKARMAAYQYHNRHDVRLYSKPTKVAGKITGGRITRIK